MKTDEGPQKTIYFLPFSVYFSLARVCFGLDYPTTNATYTIYRNKFSNKHLH